MEGNGVMEEEGIGRRRWLWRDMDREKIERCWMKGGIR